MIEHCGKLRKIMNFKNIREDSNVKSYNTL